MEIYRRGVRGVKEKNGSVVDKDSSDHRQEQEIVEKREGKEKSSPKRQESQERVEQRN